MDDPREKARRNLAYCKASEGPDAQTNARREMAAFLDFMHPNMSDEDRAELIRNASEDA